MAAAPWRPALAAEIAIHERISARPIHVLVQVTGMLQELQNDRFALPRIHHGHPHIVLGCADCNRLARVYTYVVTQLTPITSLVLDWPVVYTQVRTIAGTRYGDGTPVPVHYDPATTQDLLERWHARSLLEALVVLSWVVRACLGLFVPPGSLLARHAEAFAGLAERRRWHCQYALDQACHPDEQDEA